VTIFIGSRYNGQSVVGVPTASKGMQNCVFGPPVPITGIFTYYTTKQGDRLDNLSALIYGTPDMWYRIAYANPEVFYPDTLRPGTTLRIPT
jgi:nucleoid-associated protein YgaU